MLGYWLYLVAPLVPLKAFIFADSTQQQQQQQQAQAEQPGAQLPAKPQPSPQQQGSVAPAAAAVPQQQQTLLQQQQQQQRELPSTAQGTALAATGCLAGFASGLLGIGGGTGVWTDRVKQGKQLETCVF